MVLGGPFLPHIKDILYSKAASLSSPVVLASDIGSGSSIKGIINKNGIGLCQSCDIVIQDEKDEKPVSFKDFVFFYLKQDIHFLFSTICTSYTQIVELGDVNLRMLGHHQLQNAVTATCASLCLRDQGINTC